MRCRRSEAQPAAHGQIEITRNSARNHGADDPRSQHILHGPEGILVAPRLDENEAVEIEAQLVEPMCIRLPELIEHAARRDEHDRAGTPAKRQQHETSQEAEGGRRISVRGRNYLMKPARNRFQIGNGRIELSKGAERRKVCIGACTEMHPFEPRRQISQYDEAAAPRAALPG